MDYTLVVDAAACIPKTFFSLVDIVQIPPTPSLYTAHESIPSLLTNTEHETAKTVEELLEETIKQQKNPILYFRIDDGFTHNNTDHDSKLKILVFHYCSKIK